MLVTAYVMALPYARRQQSKLVLPINRMCIMLFCSSVYCNLVYLMVTFFFCFFLQESKLFFFFYKQNKDKVHYVENMTVWDVVSILKMMNTFFFKFVIGNVHKKLLGNSDFQACWSIRKICFTQNEFCLQGYNTLYSIKSQWIVDNMFLQNIDWSSRNNTALYPRR